MDMFYRRVLSIQSHVVSGYVGNKSATFPLQLLGFDVDAINSVQFNNHKGEGYDIVNGQSLDENDLTELYAGLSSNKVNNYSYLLTGYVKSKGFLLAICNILEDLKKVNPKLIYVCDPVLGDNGKFYVPEELLNVYKERVIPLAEIITPNQFEAELLTDMKITNLESAIKCIDKFHKLGVKTVSISSMLINGKLHALFSHQNPDNTFTRLLALIPEIKMSFYGTGDLFSALLLAWIDILGNDYKRIFETVLSTLQLVLMRTMTWYKENSLNENYKCPNSFFRELRLIQSKLDIENPQIMITAQYI